jgi:ADP-ribose pyrophosphatase YjhB (NUDIX family)
MINQQIHLMDFETGTTMRDPIEGMTERVPRLGCGAAIIRESKILLVMRKRTPEANHWGLPGGKVEPGERAEDAIVREIGEELGIAIQLGRWICTVDHRDDDAGERWVAQVYSASIVSGAPRICEPHALAAVEWFAMDCLPGPLTAATVQTIAEISVSRRRCKNLL